MRRDYDVFEKFSDGSSIWRACVCGQHEAHRKIQELNERSRNEFFAIDIQAGKPMPSGLNQKTKRFAAKTAATE